MIGLIYIRYSRKSSEAKERQIASIADQNKECETVEYREGLNTPYKLEENKSAFKPNNRPEFDKMIALIESGQANAILTWKEDRLCRNPREGGQLLQLLQDGKIKEIRTVTGAIYTPDSDHLVLQIHFGMANQYSRNLSQNVRRGLDHKAERGEYPSPSLIGFEGYGERGKRNIKPHLFEAPIIEQLFELAATSKHSLNYLVTFALEKHLKTKRGKQISKSHIYYILTNPAYYGCFYRRGQLYQGNYEAIISKKLFDNVQHALKDRSKPKVVSWANPYNGLIKCPSCGAAITTTTKIKYYRRTDRWVSYSYLHCTRRKEPCNQPPIPLDDFEKELFDKVSKIFISEKEWALGLKLVKERNKEQATRNMGQLNHLQLKYKGLQDKLNRLVDMRANGELTKEEFMSQKQFLLQEQARIKSLLADNETSSHNWLELTETFLNVAFYAREVLKSDNKEAKRKLILDVGENLFINDKKLDFRFKKPFDILLVPKFKNDMLRGQDSNLNTSLQRARSYR